MLDRLPTSLLPTYLRARRAFRRPPADAFQVIVPTTDGDRLLLHLRPLDDLEYDAALRVLFYEGSPPVAAPLFLELLAYHLGEDLPELRRVQFRVGMDLLRDWVDRTDLAAWGVL